MVSKRVRAISSFRMSRDLQLLITPRNEEAEHRIKSLKHSKKLKLSVDESETVLGVVNHLRSKWFSSCDNAPKVILRMCAIGFEEYDMDDSMSIGTIANSVASAVGEDGGIRMNYYFRDSEDSEIEPKRKQRESVASTASGTPLAPSPVSSVSVAPPTSPLDNQVPCSSVDVFLPPSTKESEHVTRSVKRARKKLEISTQTEPTASESSLADFIPLIERLLSRQQEFFLSALEKQHQLIREFKLGTSCEPKLLCADCDNPIRLNSRSFDILSKLGSGITIRCRYLREGVCPAGGFSDETENEFGPKFLVPLLQKKWKDDFVSFSEISTFLSTNEAEWILAGKRLSAVLHEINGLKFDGEFVLLSSQ